MEWLLIPALVACAILLWLYALNKGRNEILSREASFAALQYYADSFVGLDLQKARQQLQSDPQSSDIGESEWKEEEISGVELAATYPSHLLTLYSVDGEIVTASVQVLSS